MYPIMVEEYHITYLAVLHYTQKVLKKVIYNQSNQHKLILSL